MFGLRLKKELWSVFVVSINVDLNEISAETTLASPSARIVRGISEDEIGQRFSSNEHVIDQ
jgi:hypothetical protein